MSAGDNASSFPIAAANAGAVSARRQAGTTSGGRPSKTAVDTTLGNCAAAASSTLFCTPRATRNGATEMADRQRNGRTSGTEPVTSMEASSFERRATWRVGLAPSRVSRASGRLCRTSGHTSRASHTAASSFGW